MDLTQSPNNEFICDTELPHIPPVIIHEVYDHLPLSEQHPGFLTHRGEWRKLKELTGDGKGIRIGVLDTGIDQQHHRGDLSGVVDMRDFTNSRTGPYDFNGHGSHVTGHIGAKSNGGGIVGLASEATLFHAKVLGDAGSGSTRGIANGIRWCVDKGCHILNLSLGGGFSSDIEGACREAAQQGVMVFAAHGNAGNRGAGHPGNSRYTFGIVAIDYNKQVASFSSRGPTAKYSGYGVRVLSCLTRGRYGRLSGTSMACPDQAGLCGLYYSWRLRHELPLPETMEQLEGLFQPAVIDLGPPGHDIHYGYGFVDVWKLLERESSIKAGVLLSDDGTYIIGPGGQPGTFTVGSKTYSLKAMKSK